MAALVAAAGMTAGLAVVSAPTAAAQPALPAIGSAEVTQFLGDATSALNNATAVVNNVSGVLTNVSGVLQSLDFGSSAGLPLGSLGLGGVARPAPGPVSQHFGGNHFGVDIAAPMGAPIFAAADGVVINAGPASGFGLWIRIRHNDGTVTTYGHNDVNFVSVGQRVHAGQRIGNVGSRGHSTGPHLHFEVDLPGGIKTNPVAWLATRGVLML